MTEATPDPLAIAERALELWNRERTWEENREMLAAFAKVAEAHKALHAERDAERGRADQAERHYRESVLPDLKYQGTLHAAYAANPTQDWNQTEEAICDALAMGGIRAHPGDGTSMVAQLIWSQIRRAEAAEAKRDALREQLAQADAAFAWHVGGTLAANARELLGFESAMKWGGDCLKRWDERHAARKRAEEDAK